MNGATGHTETTETKSQTTDSVTRQAFSPSPLSPRSFWTGNESVDLIDRPQTTVLTTVTNSQYGLC